MNKKKYDIYKIVKILFLILFFTFLVLKGITLKFPGTTTDELGYLSYPARLVGWDWKDVIKYYPYYGVGVGILWIPLFFIFGENFTLIYHGIIIINAVLLLLSFQLSLYCAIKMFPDWNKWLRLFSCIAILFYPANIYFAQCALSETVLYTLFWAVIALLLKIEDGFKLRWLILLGLILNYMLLVHLRSIVTIACVLIFTILWGKIEKKFTVRECFIFLGILALGVVFWYLFKEGHYLYCGEITVENSRNTQLNVIDRILGVLDSLKPYLFGVLAQLYYFCMSAGVLFGGGCIYLLIENLKTIKAIFKQKVNLTKFRLVKMILGITFLANTLAFATNRVGEISRLDYVVYGRYVEYLLGPVLLLGCYVIANFKWREKAYLLAGYILCVTPIILIMFESVTSKSFALDSALGFGLYFDFDMNNVDLAYAMLKGIVIVLLVLVLQIFPVELTKYLKRGRWEECLSVIVVIGIMFMFWVSTGVAINDKIMPLRNQLYEEYSEIEEIINKYPEKEIIYIREKSDPYVINAKYLQTLLEDRPIKVIDEKDYKSIKKIVRSENYIILENSNYYDLLIERCGEYIGENNKLKIYFSQKK